MAYKMKGAPMQDTSSKHGTNANYKKSGAPGFLGNLVKGKGALGLLNPLGAAASRLGAFGDKNKNNNQQAQDSNPNPNPPPQPTGAAPVVAAPAVAEEAAAGAPMKASPAKGILGNKLRDAKSTIKKVGRKAIAAASGTKAFVKEFIGTKDHHMGSGYGKKEPGLAYDKAYNKTRNEQKGTGEFGLKEAKQTTKSPKNMSPAERQKQIDKMRKKRNK